VTRRVMRLLSQGPLHLVLVVIAVAWLTPIVALLVQSLRPAASISNSGWWTALVRPRTLTFGNYLDLLDNPAMVRGFWNTVAISVPTTIGVVVIGALAAYAFSWLRFRGRDTLFLVVVGLLVVPLQVALIPLARLFGAIGLFGSVAGVVLFHIAFGLPFAIFLLRNFFAGVPPELLDSARVDGAGHPTLFFRIIVPLALPAIASLSIFQFMWVWNDLLIALVFARPSNAPLTAAILQQTRNFGQNVDVIAPGAFLQLIVPLLVFLVFQRYFVAGVMGGSVKG
jgi:alpha-glucoside transport system permease protein